MHYVVPRDTDEPPCRALQLVVANTVPLASVLRVVPTTPVALHDEPLLSEQEVHPADEASTRVREADLHLWMKAVLCKQDAQKRLQDAAGQRVGQGDDSTKARRLGVLALIPDRRA